MSVKLDRRTRIACVLILALLAGLPGASFGACGPLCASRSSMPCCHPAGGTPTIKAPSCCEALKSAMPAEAARAVRPAPSAPAATVTAVLALPAEPLTARPLAPPPPGPPLLHEGVGLYTLHSVFLI